MKGYFGGLIKMTGLTFGSSARPRAGSSITPPIHVEETKFIESQQGPETVKVRQEPGEMKQPQEKTAGTGNLENLPGEGKKYNQPQPNQKVEKNVDSTGKAPARADQVIKIPDSRYEIEEKPEISEVVFIPPEVEAGEPEIKSPIKPINEISKEETAQPITLKTVKEWVAGSPVKETETAGGQAPLQENREFNLSIGTINLTVEEPRTGPPVNKPPQIKNNAPVINNPRSSRLERHYIRIR
jgi:hypothetical protein